jgi:protein O-mannosyl-transferase
VFAPVVGFGFVRWDDPTYILQNPLLLGQGSLRDWLLTPTLGYPIPVTVATYWVESALFGLAPGPMHGTNLLLHLLCVAGVYGVGRRLGLTAFGAALAALVFGLHPAAAEPVSWLTGRKELLACAGCLGATGLALSGRRGRSTGVFVLALLSKPVAAFLPVFDVLRRWRSEGEPLGSAIRTALPSLAAVALVVPLAWFGLQSVEAEKTHSSLAVVLRESWFALGHALGVVGGLIAPCAVQQPPSVPPPFDPVVDLLPFGVVLLVVGAARWLKPDRRPLMAGVFWAALAWLPASNLLPLTRYLADSYLYVPLVGVGWAVGSLLDALWGRSRGGALVIAAGLSGALLVGVVPSSQRWENSATLWEATAAARPGDLRACRNAGNGWLEIDRPERALDRYQACASLHGEAEFDKNIAITLCVLGRFEEALPRLERLAVDRPEDAVVERYLAGVRKKLNR